MNIFPQNVFSLAANVLAVRCGVDSQSVIKLHKKICGFSTYQIDLDFSLRKCRGIGLLEYILRKVCQIWGDKKAEELIYACQHTRITRNAPKLGKIRNFAVSVVSSRLFFRFFKLLRISIFTNPFRITTETLKLFNQPLVNVTLKAEPVRAP